MAEIIRNRTIRPSTRKETSVNYRVNVDAVLKTDTLIVNIAHENGNFHRQYRFDGKDLAAKRNISFRVLNDGSSIEIIWSGAQPVSIK